MENRAHALAAGIFVLAFGLAAALALWWLGEQSDEKTDTYLIETRRDVTGLNLQAQVRYRGIRAGKVNAIAPDPQDRRIILIRISLDRRFLVTPKTFARLGMQGLTGLAFIELLDDGTSNEPLAGKGGEPPRIGMKPSLLETLSEKGGDIAMQLSDVAARIALVMSKENTEHLSRTLQNVATASDGFKELPQVMAGLRELLSATNIKRMNNLLVQVEKAAGEASPLAAEAREMVQAMTALSRRLDQVAGQVGGEAGPRVGTLLRDLNTSSLQLSRVLQMVSDSPQAFVFGATPAAPGPGEKGFVAPGHGEAGFVAPHM